MLLPPHETWRLSTRHLGKEVRYFPHLDSTNSLALSLGNDPANHGLALLAGTQTAGRGQYGRTWTAPPDSSVLFTLLLFPPPPLRRPALLTAWAAVAVCETILAATGMQAKIKWPNDILIRGQKVCGILIEQRNTSLPHFPLATAVGIGLNVRQDATFFEQANLPLGGSLASLSGQQFETHAVARKLIEQLDEDYDRLVQGDTGTLEALWKWRLGLLGKQVVVELAQKQLEGRLLDVTLDGVMVEAEEVVQIAPEEVRHLRVSATS